MSSDNSDEPFQAINYPKQKPPPAEVAEKLMATLQSYPLLGQVTAVSDKSITLTAILEVPKSLASESWEVSVWHSVDDSEWKDAVLLPVEDGHAPQTLQGQLESVSRFYFALPLSFQVSVQFTLKFRPSQDADWRWIRDEQGLGDGRIVVPSSTTSSDKLADLIPDLNMKEWDVSSCMSQSPRTSLWALEALIPPAEGDSSTYRDITIGNPWGSFLRWFALVRQWSPWLAPRHGKSEFGLDNDAILCSFLGPQGKNLVFLAISGLGHVLPVFRRSQDGAVSVHARNDGLSEEKAIILVSEGNSFENAVAAVMYHARSLVARVRQSSNVELEETKALSNDFKAEWMENWYDGLGFCTWNALGQQLTDEKIFSAVDTLAQHNIKVSSLIIDDNWQSIDNSGSSQFQYGWKEFEAEPKAFPKGLKSTVSQIREKHPHIQHIAVWHALLGYWGGIASNGKIAQSYKTIEVAVDVAVRAKLPFSEKVIAVAEEDVSRFYSDFYRFLSDCGIDAVKTDAQFMLDALSDASPRRGLPARYLDAWTIAILRYFSAKAISCMSQIPQALFYSHMPTSRPAILVRNSDDFFPEVPSSHPWHVWSNAHNSIFMRYLNVIPDWDMFQTVHEYSGFHAAARCVSGGPIYITDIPGQHNVDLIGQMTGLTPRGKTVIFRPSVIGKAISPYTCYDDDSLLKVGTYHGASQTGNAILALFNVSARSVTEMIPLSDFSGAHPTIDYVVRAHTTGRVTRPIRIGAPGSLITATLRVRGYEILSASPLAKFSGGKHGTVAVANLGLLGKMTGVAAIFMNEVGQDAHGRVRIETRIKAFGILGIYVSALPSMTIDDGFFGTIQGSPIPRDAVALSKDDACVLEIDLAKAWDEVGLEGKWSNEIQVEVDVEI